MPTRSAVPEPEPEPAEPTPRRRASRLLVACLVFVVLGALMNPTAVRDWANGQAVGWRRDLALELADPVERVSERLELDRPRRAAADLLDWSPTVTTLPPRARPPAPPPSTTEPRPGVSIAPTTTPAPATTVAPREATVDDPLRMLTLGDSMMVDLQPAIDRVIGTDGDVVLDAHGSFFLGLTSAQTGYLEENLNPEWARFVASGRPDVVVVMLGASDFESWAPAGEPLVSGSPEWEAWIRRRADDVMGILTAGGAHVYWFTTPLMGRDGFEAVPRINQIWRDLESSWPGWVTVLDSMESLGDDRGGYRAFITSPDGRIEQLRKDDGVHFFENGADLLARQLEAALIADGWFVDGPDAGG